MNVGYSSEDVQVILKHRPDAVSAQLMTSVATSFDKALSATMKSLSQSVKEVDLFSSHDHALVTSWNSSPSEVRDICVHETFRDQASKQAQAPAISSWDGDFTYEQLDVVSDRLARLLIKGGVQPDAIVPLCFEKSCWMIVSMLAVMKAGAAFVPLDHSHPSDRLQSLLLETNSDLVLASPTTSSKFEASASSLLVVSQSLMNEDQDSTPMPSSTVTPDNSAYVLFTSGSTGKPKGVVVQHRALSSSIAAHGLGVKLGPQSRVYQFASYTFDASITEILTTLALGGCVCVPSEDQRMSNLAGSITALSATWVLLTPSVLRTISSQDITTLKTLVVGGEAISRDVVADWVGRGIEVISGYGPTEAAVIAACGPLIPEHAEPGFIGRAVGSQTWIVQPDNHDLLAPVGSIGELVLTGPTLARGYLNDPTKTAEAFINSPSWLPGQRAYKTGDLVVYTKWEGDIKFVRRRDAQIKLHGRRLELGEIEFQISRRLPATSEVVVELVKPTAQDGRPALAAFLRVPDHSDASSTDTVLDLSESLEALVENLRKALADSLPSYMVPSIWIPVNTMPKSAAGKSDRKSLRKIAEDLQPEELRTFALSNSTAVEPSTALERQIRDIWADELKVSNATIGKDDLFFRIGGDSLSAMRVVSKARNVGIPLTVADIFKHPMLSDVAAVISAKLGESGFAASTNAFDQPLEPFTLLKDSTSKSLVLDEVKRCGAHAPTKVEDAFPCTPLQEAMFAITQNDPSAYVLQQAYRLPLHIEISRFKQAWNTLARSAPILRSAIVHTEASGACQVIFDADITWAESQSLDTYLENDKKASMSYGDILARYAIVDEADTGDRYFVLTAHHSAYDGYSMNLMLDQVNDIYDKQKAPAAPAYANFIAYLQSLDKSESSHFWEAQFSGLEDVNYPRLPSATYQPRVCETVRHSISLPSDQRAADVTMATLLRAAWALVLSRASDSDDVVFGLTQNGRTAPVKGIEQMVGPTMSTVPVRVRIDEASTISDYLLKTQQDAAAIIPHEHVGLQHIKRLGPGSSMACDFKNLLLIQTSTSDSSDGSLGLEPLATPSDGFLTYALVTECTVDSQSVNIDMHIDSNVVSKDEADRILRQLDQTVKQLMSASQTATIAEIDSCTAYDRDQIFQWNGAYPESIKDCMHALVSKKVFQQPESEAICSWDASYTYSELESVTDRLAHHLVSLGVQPGTLVPICFEKSAMAILAMVAIMKVGGAFVPLDPSHPLSRLNELVVDTGAFLILKSPTAPVITARKVLEVTTDMVASLPNPASESVLPPADPNSKAYVIFTSGSTGKPKGVVISHTAICSSMAYHGPRMKLTSASRVYQFASYIFDACIAEIFTTLTVGGCVCIPSDKQRLGADLGISMKELSVTWAFFTPTVLRLISPDQVPLLETVIVGGEPVGKDNVDVWAHRVRLMLAYGPTECSVFSTTLVVQPDTGRPDQIGLPMGLNTWVVEANNYNKLAPVGSVGELLLQGPTLANGYLNDPAKTDAAFIRDPKWCQDPDPSHRRFYKTGDLVRYEADGSLLFVSRKDSQVKFNGQRIEPAEIEYHMREGSSSGAAPLVVLPKAGPYARRLVALVAHSSDQEPARGSQEHLTPLSEAQMTSITSEVAEIREYMSGKLPTYMVPSYWLAVNSLPETTSGKTDRKKILTWVQEMQATSDFEIDLIRGSTNDTIPRTDQEDKIQDILSRVLNRPKDKIPLNVSFMNLGGDSIGAMQMVSRSRVEGLDVSVQQILRSKTITDLARIAVPMAGSAGIHKESYDTPFALSPIQQMFINSVAPSKRFNQSFLLKVSRAVESQTVLEALEKLVKRHSMLRARFSHDNNGVWSQSILGNSDGCFRFSTHETTSTQDVAAVVAAAQDALDMVHGPVFSVDLCNGEGDGPIMFAVAHHLVVDLVSWRIILQDLEDLLVQGQFTTQAPFPFQKWLLAQEEHAVKLIPEHALPFELPEFDHERYWQVDPNLNTYGNTLRDTFTLDAGTTASLLGDSNKALNTQTVEIIIAALLRAFAAAFKDRDTTPAIFTEAHGREPWDNSIDLSSSVGWFTTMSPLYVPVSSSDNLADTLRQVKDRRRVVPRNGWEYFASRFLNEAGHDRFGSNTDMEVLFNYLGQYQQFEAEDSFLRLEPRTDAEFASDVGDGVQRPALFEIGAVVLNGRFEMSFTYCKDTPRQQIIKKWIEAFEQSLVHAAKALASMESRVTISDFPLMSWSDAELQTLLQDRIPQMQSIDVEDIEDIYPATSLQQTLLLNQSKNTEYYAVESIFRASVDGASASVQRLQTAWNDVVSRHPTLRTVFVDGVSQQSLVTQVVLKALPADFAELQCDYSSDVLPTFAKQQPIENYMYRAPHRFTTCVTKSGEVYAKIDLTHAIMDGASIGILFRDLELAYEGTLSNETGPLYSSFISYLNTSSEAESLKYWTSYLRDLEPCILPVLCDEPSGPKTLQSLRLDFSGTFSAIKTFCLQHGVTMSNTFQAAWSLVLRSFTNADQVAFGYLNAGRDVPVEDVENAVGLFINMLVCRVDINTSLTSPELIKQVHTDYVNSLPHQHASLSDIQHDLNLTGRPLFSSIMSYQPIPPLDAAKPSGVSFEPLKGHDPTEVSYQKGVGQR